MPWGDPNGFRILSSTLCPADQCLPHGSANWDARVTCNTKKVILGFNNYKRTSGRACVSPTGNPFFQELAKQPIQAFHDANVKHEFLMFDTTELRVVMIEKLDKTFVRACTNTAEDKQAGLYKTKQNKSCSKQNKQLIQKLSKQNKTNFCSTS